MPPCLKFPAFYLVILKVKLSLPTPQQNVFRWFKLDRCSLSSAKKCYKSISAVIFNITNIQVIMRW